MAPARKAAAKTKRTIQRGSNIDKLRELRKKLDEGTLGNSGGGKWLPWSKKMEVSQKRRIRILPLEGNDGLPFVMVKEHRYLYPSRP